MTDKFKDFCEELRSSSAKVHESSDRLVRLKLAVALTDVKLYAKVLGDFYCVFKAIEAAVEKNIDNECLKQLWINQLARTDRFEKDLQYFLGLGWKEFVKPTDAALRYVSHVEDVSMTSPVLLVAYIHTMYLGEFDLIAAIFNCSTMKSNLRVLYV